MSASPSSSPLPLRLTAAHEAGHAVVATRLGETVLRASVLPNDEAEGFVERRLAESLDFEGDVEPSEDGAVDEEAADDDAADEEAWERLGDPLSRPDPQVVGQERWEAQQRNEGHYAKRISISMAGLAAEIGEIERAFGVAVDAPTWPPGDDGFDARNAGLPEPARALLREALGSARSDADSVGRSIGLLVENDRLYAAHVVEDGVEIRDSAYGAPEYTAHVWGRTRRMLRAAGPAVDAVAGALEAAGEVDGDEVRRVISEAR